MVLVMSFDVNAESYDQFMGRYSVPLAPLFLDFARIGEPSRVLDMGCGPGALTGELVRRLGVGSVTAVDPSRSFVDAASARHPGLTVLQGSTEHLPEGLVLFDAVLAQLVVHFMTDPVAGISGMSQLVRPGGVVAACVWDFAEGGSPLDPFWAAVRRVDPEHPGEASLPGTSRGSLVELFEAAGLAEVIGGELYVNTLHETFGEWWEPFTLGVGPAGAYVAALDDDATKRLREECEAQVATAPFTVTGRAWAARGIRR